MKNSAHENIVYSTEWNTYSEFESQCQSKYERKCIDGRITNCSKCTGYCQYDGHPGFLTEKLRKRHRCIEKDCIHYVNKTGQSFVGWNNYMFSMLTKAVKT